MKKHDNKEPATKADIANVKADIVDVKADIANVKADIVDVKADIANVKADVVELAAVVDGLAAMTARGFVDVEKRFDEKITILNEKVDTGFTDIRKEMQDGFRMILAAVESVEYTKLRMRIDALEYDMEKVKEKVKK